MIRALLNESKTQTRRKLKHVKDTRFILTGPDMFFDIESREGWHKPKYRVGDLLWVRETWQSLVCYEHLKPSEIPYGSDVQYPATYDGLVSRRRPGIFMPRWASRLTLEVTSVKVERLQDITEEDAKAEGVDATSCANVLPPLNGFPSYRSAFAILWESLNGAGSWGKNPFVCAISFTVHKCNIDAPGGFRVKRKKLPPAEASGSE
jgi:hypothetical protein